MSLTYFRSWWGRLRHMHLSEACERIKTVVAERQNFELSKYTHLDRFVEGEIQVPPSTPVWNDRWYVDRNLQVEWVLQRPFTSACFNKFTTKLVDTNPRFNAGVRCVWPGPGRVYLDYPTWSVHERRHYGYTLRVDPELVKASPKVDEMQAIEIYREVAALWNVHESFRSDTGTCRFVPDRQAVSCGEFFGGAGDDSIPSSVSVHRIDNGRAAANLASSTLDCVIGVKGPPRIVEFYLSAYDDDATDCAALCRDIAPLWGASFYPEVDRNYDPYDRPGIHSGRSVYPICWHECTPFPLHLEKFTDIHISVEHTASDSSLLFFTNHDAEWLRSVVSEAGYESCFESMREEDMYDPGEGNETGLIEPK